MKLPPDPRLIFEGDPTAAMPFVGIAKKWARQAYQSGVRARTYLLGDARIRVENYPESYLSKVFIQAGCRANIRYLSGIHEIASSNSFLEFYAGQYFPSRETDNGIERKWYTYGNIEGYIWPPHHTDLETANGEQRFIIEWVVPSRPPLPDVTAGGYAPYPNMYTGKMRLVQQKIYGYLRVNPFGGNRNVGVFIPDIEEPELHINRQRWIIDIRTDGRVLAYKIDFVNELKCAKEEVLEAFAGLSQEEQDRYDYGLKESFSIPANYVPFSEWDDTLEDTGILLAEAGGPISAAMEGKAPITTWHSTWAFSYDGHEAQAVVIGPFNYQGAPLWRAYRYKLSVSQNNQGVPNDVEISLVEEDYLWTIQSEPAPLQDHPLSAPITNAFSEFIYYWKPDPFINVSWPDEHDAPIYAYYNKDNTLTVLRHRFIKQFSLPDEVVNEPPIGPGTPYYGTSYCAAPPPNQATYKTCSDCSGQGNWAKVWTREWYTHRKRYKRTNCYYVSGQTEPVSASGYEVGVDVKMSYGKLVEVGTVGGYFCPDAPSYRILLTRETYEGNYKYPYQPYNVDKELYHSVGIPAFNREAFFYYESISDTTGPHRIDTRVAEFSAGPRVFVAGWVVRFTDGAKMPGSDFVPTLAGAPGDVGGLAGNRLGPVVSSENVPESTETVENYYCFTSAHEKVELLKPYDPQYWFSRPYQIYSVPIGAYSGCGAILPWPRTDGNGQKTDMISVDNGSEFIQVGELDEEDEIDYPINEANQYVSGPLSYPLIVFIGDDSTSTKPLMPDLVTDLENIKIEEPPE